MLTERPDLDMARAFLKAIVSAGTIFEIRILNARRGGPSRLWANTYSGFFTCIETALSFIGSYTGADTAGVYVTINPLKGYVLNWNHNIIAKSVASASDEDVESVQTLFLDIDPTRPRFTCATSEESEAAKARGNEVALFLIKECGFPMPIWAGSSGSGVAAFYRVVGADSALIERCLAALHARFSDDRVIIDASVHNPARIARVAGTINAKSPTPQEDRPWRRATGRAFDTIAVTPDQLEALAAMAPETDVNRTQTDAIEREPYTGESYDLRSLLDKSGIAYSEKQRGYGTAFELRQCLTSNQHDTGASFIQMNSGAVAYRCLHNSCSDKGWNDVKAQLGLQSTPESSINIRSSAKNQPFTPIKIGANGRVAS